MECCQEIFKQREFHIGRKLFLGVNLKERNLLVHELQKIKEVVINLWSGRLRNALMKRRIIT